MPECFVIMPLTTPLDAVERYRGDRLHFHHVLEHLFAPAVEQAGFDLIPPSAQGADLIQAEIIKNLERADVVLCDISCLNANVFFELGIRTALDRPICLARDEHVTAMPFDTGIINCHSYDSGLNAWELQEEIGKLAAHLTATIERTPSHNTLWRHFGLTHRANEATATVSEDPDESRMQLILDELQQLRRTTDRAEWVEAIADDSDLETAQFVERAQQIITGEGSMARSAGVMVRGKTVTFLFQNKLPDAETKRKVHRAGQIRGLDTEFGLIEMR